MTAIPQFRMFHKDDLPELEKMILALYQEDPPGEEISSQKILLTVQELLSHPEKGGITMFCGNNTVVGYAIVIYYWSNEYGGNIALIDEFYIKSAWRGKGIGINFLEHLATDNTGNLKGLLVEETPSNERVFIYYSRNGFSPTTNRHLFKKMQRNQA